MKDCLLPRQSFIARQKIVKGMPFLDLCFGAKVSFAVLSL
jgi:hypothetical protein